MKKLFLVLALLIIGSFLIPQGAFAACDPNTDNSDWRGWCVDQFGQLTPKSITTSSQQLSSQGGYQVPVSAVTSANTSVSVLAQQSGTVFNDLGGVTSDTLSGMGSKFTLPRAVVGLSYTLTVGTKSTSTIDTVDTADTFMNSISGTGSQMGDSLKSPGQAGDSVQVVCTQAGKWSITAMRGSWTNGGTS